MNAPAITPAVPAHPVHEAPEDPPPVMLASSTPWNSAARIAGADGPGGTLFTSR